MPQSWTPQGQRGSIYSLAPILCWSGVAHRMLTPLYFQVAHYRNTGWIPTSFPGNRVRKPHGRRLKICAVTEGRSHRTKLVVIGRTGVKCGPGGYEEEYTPVNKHFNNRIIPYFYFQELVRFFIVNCQFLLLGYLLCNSINRVFASWLKLSHKKT